MSSWLDYDITNPTYFNLVGTQINTAGGGGTGSVIYAITVGGVITSLNIINGAPVTGSYTSNFSPAITGTGSGASVTLTVAGGSITGYTSLVGGTGYFGTAPAWRLNTATNPWSALLAGLATLHAPINANLQPISNLASLGFTAGTLPGSPTAGMLAVDSSGFLNFEIGGGFQKLLTTSTTLPTLANGANQNVATGTASFLEVLGPTGSFNIGGFAGGFDARMLVVFNRVFQAMTINHQDTGSTLGNRIFCPTGANVVLPVRTSAATFMYEALGGQWILVSTF